MSGKITTHALDTSTGKPASGLRVELYYIDETGGRQLSSAGLTEVDGRMGRPLAEGGPLRTGVYELLFRAGDYYRRRQGRAYDGIWDEIPIRFTVSEPGGHYHIPLLLAPGGFSAYRGS